MSESILSANSDQSPEATNVSCYLCGRINDHRIAVRELQPDLRVLLKGNMALAGELAQLCAHCVELFSRAKAQIDSHHIVFEQTDHVLPTPLRMNADERFTWRGVTIAFLDSGFYAHGDLTRPENRIVAYHSIFDAEDDRTSLETTDVASWHGMMTSVVAARNGYLSGGLSRGIAPWSQLGLVKSCRSRHISEVEIESGPRRVIEHPEKYEGCGVNNSAGRRF